LDNYKERIVDNMVSGVARC